VQGGNFIESIDSNNQLIVRQCTDVDSDGYNTDGGVCGALDCNDNNIN